MSNKKLVILGIIAVVAAGLAILQTQIRRGVHTADFSSSPLVEGLNIEAVSGIQMTSENGGKTLRLAKKNEKFVVTDKDNYPANVSKINDLISNCLDIRTTEKITSSHENHEDLKVTESTARYVVAFLDSEEKPIVTVLLSETDPETRTAHARLLSSDDVYSIHRSPWLNTGPMDYIDAQLPKVTNDEIDSVAVKTPEGSYVLSSPQGSQDIQLKDMAEDKQYKETTYKTVFGVLNDIQFDDVMSVANTPEDLNFDHSYTCKLYDLTVYKLSIAKKDDETYVKISADYLDKTPVEKTVGEVESEEELKKKEAKLLATDAVKEFNTTHKGWAYRIPSHKADDLTKPLSELIEDIPQPEPEEEPAIEEAGSSAPETTPELTEENEVEVTENAEG